MKFDGYGGEAGSKAGWGRGADGSLCHAELVEALRAVGVLMQRSLQAWRAVCRPQAAAVRRTTLLRRERGDESPRHGSRNLFEVDRALAESPPVPP